VRVAFAGPVMLVSSHPASLAFPRMLPREKRGKCDTIDTGWSSALDKYSNAASSNQDPAEF